VRPSNNYRNIFIRHLAPYEPFSADNNFSQVMKEALTQAGMSQRKGLRGIYLFRHSLATRLLKEGKSFKSISDVLGHTDVSSSFKYTKVDIDELRTVSISIKEVMS
jgi:Site-specific recombinase XerD